MSKKNTSSTPEPQKVSIHSETFIIPEYGITIDAPDAQDAIKQAKAKQSKAKDKKDK